MTKGGEPGTCALCGKTGVISAALGVCKQCILDNYAAVEGRILHAHAASRSEFGLPAVPPSNGSQCIQCVNMCRPAEGKPV